MVFVRSDSTSERGNVLFLVLIAVALFAALAYAVTKSTRTSNEITEEEKSAFSSAVMSQYPATLRTSLVRMVLTGTKAEQVKFNSPSDFADVEEVSELVFHPNGGAAVFQHAAADVMAGDTQGEWSFNANFSIPEVGIEDVETGNDIIAFLPGVSKSVCENANTELALDVSSCELEGNIPLLAKDTDEQKITEFMDDSYSFPETGEILQAEGCTVFTGELSGCFYDPDVKVGDEAGANVYYFVLKER